MTFIKEMKIGKTDKLLFFLFLFFTFSSVKAQLAIKTNLLYDATTTPNLGAEVGLGKKHTAQLFYGFNPWEFDSSSKGERKVKHWLLMPEYRWWSCTTFNGWFFGIHGMGGEFNAGNVDLPIPGVFFNGDNLQKEVKDYRYEGRFLGGGATIGYQWILGRHWNLEAELGLGYDHVWYDKYPCSECGKRIEKAETNYAGITKVGLSVLYLF